MASESWLKVIQDSNISSNEMIRKTNLKIFTTIISDVFSVAENNSINDYGVYITKQRLRRNGRRIGVKVNLRGILPAFWSQKQVNNHLQLNHNGITTSLIYKTHHSQPLPKPCCPQPLPKPHLPQKLQLPMFTNPCLV